MVETAFAVDAAFVKWQRPPSAREQMVQEGGGSCRWASVWANASVLGVMTKRISWATWQAAELTGFHANSITLSCDVSERLGAHSIEFFSVASEEQGSEWVGQFDLGATFGLTPDATWMRREHSALRTAHRTGKPFTGLDDSFLIKP